MAGLRSESLPSPSPDKKVYFASDFHLGAAAADSSHEHELKIIRWLDHIKSNAAAIFLVGDVFDFWFEYKHVVPKGFIRFQGKLAELADAGIPIYLFTGNHDLWYRNYFADELNLEIHTKPISIKIGEKMFMVGHGDGLGEGDHFFKVVKKVFVSKFPQWAFRWIHPDVGISMARFWSHSSRERSKERDEKHLGEDEVLLRYCREVEQQKHHDYYVFGHRHLPMEMGVAREATYFNLGEWFQANSYLEFNGEKASLQYFSD